MFTRNETRKINIGGVTVGGGSPIAIQSMTNTFTSDVEATVAQIKRLEEAGCDIVRVAVPDEDAALAIPKIKKESSIPLVADIHFDYKLALLAIEGGVDKVRINPGNIGSAKRTKEVVSAARSRKIPVRIGINGGSLEKSLYEKYGGTTPEAMVESAMGHVKILEDLGFEDIVISLKSTDLQTTLKAYELMAEKRNYPLHIGLTESGTMKRGVIKSAVLLGAVLSRGIGDTVRVSLTGDPVNEINAARSILSSLDLCDRKKLNFISCPTCGRTKYDMENIAVKVEDALEKMEENGEIDRKITVAVMGCAVNGPGEAKDADIGLAGGDGKALLFVKGKTCGILSGDDIAGQFIEAVRRFLRNNE